MNFLDPKSQRDYRINSILNNLGDIYKLRKKNVSRNQKRHGSMTNLE